MQTKETKGAHRTSGVVRFEEQPGSCWGARADVLPLLVEPGLAHLHWVATGILRVFILFGMSTSMVPFSSCQSRRKNFGRQSLETLSASISRSALVFLGFILGSIGSGFLTRQSLGFRDFQRLGSNRKRWATKGASESGQNKHNDLWASFWENSARGKTHTHIASAFCFTFRLSPPPPPPTPPNRSLQ